jgi:hypothetical protein
LELSVTSQAQHRALMARAASGIAAAPLRSVMNSRRLMHITQF